MLKYSSKLIPEQRFSIAIAKWLYCHKLVSGDGKNDNGNIYLSPQVECKKALPKELVMNNSTAVVPRRLMIPAAMPVAGESTGVAELIDFPGGSRCIIGVD